MTPEALLDLFVLAPVGLVEVDEDGRVEVANLAARTLLTPFTRAGSLDDLFVALGAVAPDLAARVRGFDAPRGVIVDALELLAPGEQRGVHLSLVKVAPRRIVAVVNDAGALATTRGQLSDADQRRRAIEGAVRDHAIFTVTANGVIDSWSDAAERVHQWPAAAVLGQSMTLLLPPDSSSEAFVQDTLALAARNGWCEQEGNRQRQDGSLFWASTVVTALRATDGAAVGFSVVSHDVSERRRSPCCWSIRTTSANSTSSTARRSATNGCGRSPGSADRSREPPT